MPEIVGDVVSRVPAAIPALLKEKTKPRTSPSFEVWRPPCLDANTQLTGMQTSSAWLRVSTNNCDRGLQISETKLENKSNGYVATVFTPTPDKLTSDFIPLTEGPNQFQMEVKMNSGERFSYRWTIDRRPIASN